ncbi:hypothetical protein MBLNU230_g6520t1 [Neophaeotheca triangularis]
MADYTSLPSAATLKPQPFKANIDDKKLSDLQNLIKLSPIGPQTWENSTAGREKFGLQRDWLINAKDHWANKFNWRDVETRINNLPNYTAKITDDVLNTQVDVHFIALYSQKADAIPLAFYHGWPGSFLEFLPILELLKSKYSPQDLPYHIIVPSLPGYTYSSGPGDVDYNIRAAASCMHNLMLGLGFGSGYLAQGGDLGSFISNLQAVSYDACKGFHLNMVAVGPPENAEKLHIDEVEAKALPRGKAFHAYGSAYGMEHGTRTGTIGLALSSSPLALLAWIGEKFLEWTDEDPPLDDILASVTLYWLTETFPRCIYPYRGIYSEPREPMPFVQNKPFGYSFFPLELMPTPKSWAAEKVGELMFYGQHTTGGHFAAMEQPKVLLADVEEWAAKAWKQVGGKNGGAGGKL